MKAHLTRHFRRWAFLLLPFLATAICWGTLHRDFALWRDGTPVLAWPLPAFTWDDSKVPYSYEVEGLEYEGVADVSTQDLAMLEELSDQPLPILYSSHNPAVSGQPGAGARLLEWMLALAVILAIGNAASRGSRDSPLPSDEPLKSA
jgi:hypothetical protein